MVKEIVYCDRCGSEVHYPIVAKAKLYSGKKLKHIELVEDRRMDLCQQCIDSLVEWFNEGK